MTRVLIADDNPQNLYLLEVLLEGCGYEVTSAGNGVDALDLARKTPPDLIITDILMPDLDGFELCRQCKADEQLRRIPFIFYTAHYTDPKDEKFAFRLGAERYITKPQQPELLVGIVREVLLKHAQGKIASPAEPPGEDKGVDKQYSKVLFRQLEKKVMELEHEVVKRKQIESQLAERLQFETLLSEISAHFVNLSADRIDDEIRDAGRRICELLHLDLAAIWQWSDETPGFFTLTHFYGVQEGPQPLDRMTQEDFPWCAQQILSGRIVAVSSLEELPAEAARDRESCRVLGIKSNLTFPLSVGSNPPIGILGLNTTRTERDWPDALVKRLQLVAQIFANALQRKRMGVQLQERLREIEELKQRLENENVYLQQEVKLLVEHTDIVGQSAAMKKVLAQVEQVARTDATVLLLGETGTGKELLARAIHRLSSRKDRLLVTVNCASLPPTLIESELFGREKGAYTGALTRMAGRFELADGATLFLDEIGEFPLDLQGKLLRVLEEGKFERLGSSKSLHVDARIIAATNRNIEQEVKDAKFRRDLFYRLNVFPIAIPPLRERPDDIPFLVRAIVKEFQKRMGKEIESIPKKTMQALQSYSWPGNVRELRNLIEHAMILSKSKTLDIEVPKRASSETDATGNLEDMERRHIVAVLEKTGWRIAGPGGAAEVLGLKRTTLQAKMNKLGIKRSNKQMPK